jgi:hypothetical protein
MTEGEGTLLYTNMCSTSSIHVLFREDPTAGEPAIDLPPAVA